MDDDLWAYVNIIELGTCTLDGSHTSFGSESIESCEGAMTCDMGSSSKDTQNRSTKIQRHVVEASQKKP